MALTRDIQEKALTLKPGTAAYRGFRLAMIREARRVWLAAGCHEDGPFISRCPHLRTALDVIDAYSDWEAELAFPEGAD